MNARNLFLIKIISVLFVWTLSTSDVKAQLQPNLADSFLNFINVNKTRAAIYITLNDTPIAKLNETKLMPLASTVKIMVAIEFAQQSIHEMINENAFIPLAELDKYYIPNTDGGAHEAWLDYARKTKAIENDSVRLIDVARGMIMYSSNANTEYLMDLLGFDAVKDNIALFKLKQHTAIYPLVGSLFLYQPVNKKTKKKSPEDVLLKDLAKLSDKQYSYEAYNHHLDLKEDSTFKQTFNGEAFSPRMQKLWSDRLPASTAMDYVKLVSALNNREVLDEDVYFTIGETLEFPMENKAFQQVFKHYGVKGGSTPYVLTHVLYLTMKNGTRMEMAIFFNNLLPAEEKKLEKWLDPFEAQVIFDKSFREKIKF